MKQSFKIDPNANGRTYSPNILRRAVADAQEKIAAGRMIGEIDPPDGRSRIAHASHIIRSMRLDDDGTIRGEVELTDSEAGRFAKEALTGGVPLELGLRGIGSVKDGVVGDDYRLISVDFVHGRAPDVIDKLAAIVEDEDEDEEDE